MASQRTRPLLQAGPYRFCLLQGRTDSHAPPEMAAARLKGAERYRMVRMSSLPGLWRTSSPPPCRRQDALLPGVGGGILCKTPQTAAPFRRPRQRSPDDRPRPAWLWSSSRTKSRCGKRQRPHPAHAAGLQHLRGYSSGAVDDAFKHPHQLKHMPIYLGWSVPSRQQAHPHPRAGRADKYQNLRRRRRRKPMKAHHLLEGAQFIFFPTPTTEDGPSGRPIPRKLPCPLEYHVICPVAGRAAHEVRPDPLARRRTGPRRCSPGGWPCTSAALRRPVVAGRTPTATGPCAKAFAGGEKRPGLLFAICTSTGRSKSVSTCPRVEQRYFVALSEVAHAFLKWKKTTRLEDLKNFMNQYKAELWKEVRAERQGRRLLPCAGDARPGVVPAPSAAYPAGVAALVAGVDT